MTLSRLLQGDAIVVGKQENVISLENQEFLALAVKIQLKMLSLITHYIS